MKNKTSAFPILSTIWLIFMICFIGFERFVGDASGGEYAIGLLLWFDVATRLFDLLDRRYE